MHDSEQLAPADTQTGEEATSENSGGYGLLAAEDPISPTLIEKLHIYWTPSGSNQTLQDDGTLFIKPQDWGYRAETVTAKFEYDISGSTDHAPGSVVMKIPTDFFKARDGWTGGSIQTGSLPIPAAPTVEDNEYNYTIEDGYYVITNCKTIPAASRFQGSISFTLDKPPAVVDMSIQNDLSVTMTISDEGQEPVTATSEILKGQVDTQVSLEKVNKRSLSFHTEWNNAWGEKPADADSYVYVVWGMGGLTYASQSNQPAEWNVLDTPDDGELVGYWGPKMGNLNMGADYPPAQGAPTVSATGIPMTTAAENYGSTNGTSCTVTSLVRYPKSVLTDGQEHVFTNTTKFTVTPADGVDDPTTATAVATYTYRPVKFTVPPGTSTGDKSGNPGYLEGGINALQAGDPILLDATFNARVSATGYIYTLSDGADPNDPASYGDPDKPFRVELTDDYVFLQGEEGGLELVDGDFEFAGAHIDSSLTDYLPNTQRGTYSITGSYVPRSADVYGKFGSDWIKLGAYVYKGQGEGAFEDAYPGVHYQNSFSGGGGNLDLPSGCTGLRMVTETTHAGASLSLEPVIRLLPSERVVAWAKNTEPSQASTSSGYRNCLYINNVATFRAVNSDGEAFGSPVYRVPQANAARISALDAERYDTAVGHASSSGAICDVDVKSELKKTCGAKNNPARKRYELAYSLTAREYASWPSGGNLTWKALLEPQESGTFYDLLPLGVDPDLSTVRADLSSPAFARPYDDEGSPGDILASVEAVSNWNGTGRTMLIAHVDNPEHKMAITGSSTESGFRLTFTAYYTWDSLRDYGTSFNNIAAYMSGNDSIAKGWPDDGMSSPYSAYRVLADVNQDGITGEGAPTNVLYADCPTRLAAAVTTDASLSKRIRGGGEYTWVDGVRDGMVKLETGEDYQYCLRYATGQGTQADGIILYDSLENYAPEEDSADYGSEQWRGTLTGVDTSQIDRKGVDTVVYYSTVEKLSIEEHSSLSDPVWSATPPDDLSAVTAVAIDCRTKTDGTPFTLPEQSSVVAIINMAAPADESEVAKLYYADAHAFNQVYTLGNISDDLGQSSIEQLIHNEYTKASLVEPVIDVPVKKIWDVPAGTAVPESLTVKLLANEQPTDFSAEITADDDWAHTFTGVPKYDASGAEISYSAAEDVPDGFQFEASAEDGVWTLTNTTVQPIDVDLAVTKAMAGRSFADGDSFTFSVEPREDSPMPSGVADDGTVTITPAAGEQAEVALGSVTFSEEGTYTYTITEKAGNDAGVAYSAQTIETTVTAQRGSTGALKATVACTGGDGEDADTFTNTYYEPIELSLEAHKVLTGRTLDEGEFTFELRDEDGELLGSASNDAEGKVAFDPIGYTLADADKTFTYTITELPGEAGGVTYDAHAESVEVAVEAADGKLAATASYDADGATFNNAYSASGVAAITAAKTLEGAELEAGVYTFELLDADGQVIQTTTNGYDLDGDGAISGEEEISAIRFDVELGIADIDKSYSYTVREVAGDDSHVTYDSHEASYTVSVSDGRDGTLAFVVEPGEASTTFANVYTADPPAAQAAGGKTASRVPRTGEMLLFGAPAFVAFVAALVLAATPRKRYQPQHSKRSGR